ncbi:MAG TPA: autotransporter-associated beta strand repeat-containing protein, partial [Verrucomicrobiae bacterium]|nr:autotransporter-associated beta strand repeat-containing protein [Verrucomicrobiae bacterium]
MFVAVAMAGSAFSAAAQTAVYKANSFTSLTTGSDWQGGVAPGATNIAIWNSGSGTPAPEPLGGNLAWAGIQILNPGGPITITPDGNALTNGEVGIVGLTGIDMSSATVSLTMSNNLVINGLQNWNIASGQSLNIDGVLSRNNGGAVRMYFDPSAANIYTTNGSATVSTSDGTPNAMLGGTYGNNFFGTINDTDYAAEVTAPLGLQIVPGSSVSGLYTLNPSGTTPSDGGNTTLCDVENLASGSSGVRMANNRTYGGFRFNSQQTNTTIVYNGLPSWQIWVPSGRTITANSVLITTNVGNSPILVNNGAFSGGTTGHFRIGNGGQQNLLVYQNDPAASFIIQPNMNLNQQGTGSLVKMGVGAMLIQGTASYTGGTEIYEGTLEIDGLGTVGTGALNVFGGAFAQSSGSTNSAATTIFTGATNNVLAVSANSQSFDNSTVTFDAGTTLQFIYSNSIAPSSASPALTITNLNGLSLNSPVNVAVLCGSFSAGTFPLVSYAGTLGGAGFAALSAVVLPPHIFGYLSNDVTHSYIDLVITNVDQPIAWNAGSGTWDIGGTANWLDPLGSATTYQQIASLGDNVLFNDSAPGPSPITVTLNSTVTPSSVTVNNANNAYIVSGNGDIAGSDTLVKTGSGTVTLATTNSFTGGIDINGGAVIFDTLANLGAGAISFNGGTLQYNGNTDDISTRNVVLNAGGGTINTAGSSVNYANPIGNNGVGGLTKTGPGTLTLNGTNTYFGNTTVSQGTLELGANTYLTNSPAIVVNGVLDAAVSGVNLTLSAQSSQILAGTGQVNGVVTVPAFTTVSPGTNGATGTLTINGGYTLSGGTNFLDVAGTSNDLIAVTGNVTLNSGTVQVNLIGTVPNGRYIIMSYSGSLSGSVAAITPIYTAANQIVSLDSSVAGQIAVVLSTAAHDVLTWPGTASSWDELGTLDWLNGGTPWAYTNGDSVTFNDSETGGNTTIELMTNVQPTLVTVSNTVVTTYTIADGTGIGGGSIDGNGSLVKDGTGTLVMQTPNTYRGTTTIKNGTLQIGNGGIGSIGTGNVTNNGSLLFQQGDAASHIVPGAVSGTGSITENASATVVLAGNNTYTGPTTISAGTLQVGNGGTTGSLGGTSAVTNNGTLLLDLSGNYTFPA